MDEETKANIRTVLANRKCGLTLAQLIREYRTTIGQPFEEQEGAEQVLKTMQDVRCERAVWGDKLYFLNSDDAVLPSADNVVIEKPRSWYNLDEETKKLKVDSRGWCTICWNTFADNNDSNIRRQFSVFGQLADVKIAKGKAFVRYHSRSDAEAAMRKYGIMYHIEAAKASKDENGLTTSTPTPKSKSALASISNVDSPTKKDQSENRSEREIYVSDLPLEFNEIDVEELFLNYDVRGIRVNASASRRTAFVELSSRQEVEKAIKNLCTSDDGQKHYWRDKKIFVRLLPRDPILSAKFKTPNLQDAPREREVSSGRAEESTSIGGTSSYSSENTIDISLDRKSPSADQSIAQELGSLKLCSHAVTKCKNYPKCRPNCDFQHPLCPAGVQCQDRFCSFDHSHRAKKCHLCIRQSERGVVDTPSIITECDHRKKICSDFPRCPYGARCSFLHQPCPDVDCKNWDKCVYEHDGQKKICYVCSKAINAEKEKTKDGNERVSTSGFVSVKDDVPCRYDVKCWTPQCPYKHPPEWSKKACPFGLRCRREECPFIHPPVTI